jgi:hypothetical protein
VNAQQRIVIVLALVVAALGGGLLVFLAVGRPGAPPSTIPVEPSATAGQATPSASPTASPAVTPTLQPTPGATPTPVPTATSRPTTAPGPAATIVFTELKLDAADDPAGQDRLLTFTARGTGPVSVALSTLSPMGSPKMCLVSDGTPLGCTTTGDGTLTAENVKAASTFEVTLRGSGVETPVVSVTLTFPAAKPSVTLDGARFDGTMYPELNGIQAIVQPRADGDVQVTADWGGHPFLWELDLFEQGGGGTQTLANQGPATRMDKALAVTAANPWKIVLQNIEGGFGVTPMTVTIAWP